MTDDGSELTVLPARLDKSPSQNVETKRKNSNNNMNINFIQTSKVVLHEKKSAETS